MQAIEPTAGFRIKPRSVMPGLDTAADAEVVTLAKALAGRNDQGKVAYGTEAGLFHGQGGIPTVVCGPGSIAQAHKPDEFITLDQVAKAEAFMRKLMDRVCVAPG
jgi:acetylornithine deacetylase